MVRQKLLSLVVLAIGLGPLLGYADTKCTASCQATLHYADPSAPKTVLETAEPTEVEARASNPEEAKAAATRLCPVHDVRHGYRWSYSVHFSQDCDQN